MSALTFHAPEAHRWRAFSLLGAACFMTTVDLTIVNVALPAIGRSLRFSETNLQ
jgi:MFS family permease